MICQQEERAAGRPYPRTCPTCGLGPCRRAGASLVVEGQPQVNRDKPEKTTSVLAGPDRDRVWIRWAEGGKIRKWHLRPFEGGDEYRRAHIEDHPDETAVDRFATMMKIKLHEARLKGREGWDDPARCSIEELRSLFRGHVAKANPGNWVDLALLAMMIHLREQAQSELDFVAAQAGLPAITPVNLTDGVPLDAKPDPLLDRRPIRQRLARFYSAAELDRWLYQRHPQLDGATPVQVVDRGEGERVHRIIDRLERDAYL